MGSKERLERSKEKIRKDILDAAMSIVKTEGCLSLSMRKIADAIEYSAPVIYSYFLNKEAVEIALAKQAYTSLNNHIGERLLSVTGPEERLTMIIMTFLEFTIKEKELYQLIYATGVGVKDVKNAFPELITFIQRIRKEIEDMMGTETLTDEVFERKYLTLTALVIGLASLNYYHKDIAQSTNEEVMEDALSGIIDAIKKTA